MAEAQFPTDPQSLRRYAEDIARAKPESVDLEPWPDKRRLLHELCVHQIELETQNENLRRAQQELEQSRQRYYELYDFAPVGYFTLSERGIFQEVNLTCCHLLQTDRRALLHQGITSHIAPSHHGAYFDFRERMKRGDVSAECEVRLAKDRDGEPVYVQLCGGMSPGEAGQLRITMTDISARKKAEGELQRFNEKLEETVAQRTEELRNMMAEVLIVEQRERRRLSMELHDYLAQLLVVCKYTVDGILRKAAGSTIKQDLEKLSENLQQAQTYTRTLIADISPTVIYDIGLAQAVDKLIEEMRHHGLRVTVARINCSEPWNNDYACMAFQILRELLHNVYKHAETEEAHVQLERSEATMAITVSDHGKGFDPNEIEKTSDVTSFGLPVIRERVMSIGGEFHIEAHPGQGTTATLTVPTGPPGTPEEWKGIN